MSRYPIFLLLCTLLMAGCATESAPESSEVPAAATTPEDWPAPDSADVTTLDGLITAYYEVVSGPAGEVRDWDRDKSLHIPGATVVITRNGDAGEVEIDHMTISDYHDRQPGPARSAFYEYEVSRQVHQHGTTVHIWSVYAFSSTPGGEVEGQGVNSIETIWDGSRYWITSWTYDGRSDAPPVDERYLNPTS